MTTLWLSVPTERERSIAFVQAKPELSVMILAIGSSAAFLYNVSNYYYTMVASAVVMMVTAQLTKVVLLTASAIIDQISTWYNWIGICSVHVAVVVFAYLQYQDYEGRRKQKAVQQTAPAPAATAAGPARSR